MRLLQPSPGEAYDRMTILVLKMKHSDRIEFKQEHEALVKYMTDNHYKVPTQLANDLGIINSALWNLEDEQRKLMSDTHFGDYSADDPRTQFYDNAVTIVKLNDKRADTVKAINEACGITSVEKVYSK